MREKHQKAFPLIFDKCITVIPSTKPMQERESGQRDDNMGRDIPSRILDDERSTFAAQSMARWNGTADEVRENKKRLPIRRIVCARNLDHDRIGISIREAIKT